MKRSPLPFAIDTYSYTSRFSALDCLRHLSDLGFSGFEVMLIPGHFWPSEATAEDRGAVANFLAERGLRIETLNQPNLDINLAALTSECRDYSCGVIISAMELAAEWQAGGVVVNPGKTNPVFPQDRETLETCFKSSLDILVPQAARLGVQLIVKNHPLSWLHAGGDLVAFFDRYGWDSVGLGYDVANALFAGESVLETLPRLSGRLSAVYVADTPVDDFRHAPVGEGAVDFPPIAAALAEMGWRGPTILEIVSPDPDPAILNSVAALTGFGWPQAA
jgi:L-ribulose-5-phosphate 3-epimerase